MNSEALLEMLRTDRLTEEHVRQLDKLIAAYPWFGPARFLRLKAMHQLDKVAGQQEIGLAAVFSGNRSHLYRWIHGELELLAGMAGSDSSELEFITDDEVLSGEEGDLLMLDDETNSEKSIPEKKDVEMEEPEIGEADSVPVSDPLDDEVYEEDVAGIEEADSVPVSDPLDDEVYEEDVAGIGEEPVQQEQREHSGSGQPAQQESGHPVRTVDPVQSGTASGSPSNQSIELIEQFLNSEAGVIKADKKTSLEGDVSERSVKEDDSFITNTLAKIYVKQGLHAKAIYAYERLSLKYPEKSAYFAAQIEKIKNNTNI